LLWHRRPVEPLAARRRRERAQRRQRQVGGQQKEPDGVRGAGAEHAGEPAVDPGGAPRGRRGGGRGPRRALWPALRRPQGGSRRGCRAPIGGGEPHPRGGQRQRQRALGRQAQAACSKPVPILAQGHAGLDSQGPEAESQV
ncbi:unnamed protein product, partial [Prorocentrum cordatum]